MALVGMICGIAGLVLTFTPLYVVGLIAAIVGVVASAIGLKRREGGMAVAGLVCSIIALVIWLIAVIVVGMIFGAAAATYGGAAGEVEQLNELIDALENM